MNTMTRKLLQLSACLGAAALIVFALGHGAAQSKDEADKKGDAKPADRSADEKAIRASAEHFVKAFNKADAKGAAEQFLLQAEYLNSDGEAFEGREAIQKDLEEFFKEYPKAQIVLEIDSIRFIGPRVAIEEGRTAVTREPGNEPIRQTYVAVDILTDGDWQLASVRETTDEDGEESLTPHDHLEPLGWLVGEWMDESDAGVVKTSCRWTEDENYLIQDFELIVAGHRAVTGQQRIGWDPLTRHVKSWVFDSQGGYSEGLWTEIDGRWVVKAQGVRPDGTVGTGTNIYTPRTGDSYFFDSTNRVVGDDVEPDFRVVVVRRPPAIKEEEDAKGSPSPPQKK
jgi:uncharacterized protein (TIGR02246 family)